MKEQRRLPGIESAKRVIGEAIGLGALKRTYTFGILDNDGKIYRKGPIDAFLMGNMQVCMPLMTRRLEERFRTGDENGFLLGVSVLADLLVNTEIMLLLGVSNGLGVIAGRVVCNSLIALVPHKIDPRDFPNANIIVR